MEPYIKKADIVAEIEKRLKANGAFDEMGDAAWWEDKGMCDAYKSILSFLDTLEVKEVNEEPVSNDLEEAIKKYLKSLRKSHFEGYDIERAFKKGAQWQKEHLWKDAQGNDLPEIDKEVIALIEAFGHYKVIFAHRVDENVEIHTSIDGKPLVLHPKRHDKGGWNIPDVKFWLDCELPKMEE